MANPPPDKAVSYRPVALAAGLMMSLPFLLPVHRLPLPSFESEWLALVLGLFAALGMVVASRSTGLHLPAVALAPLALAVVVLFQLAGSTLAYGTNAVVFAAFLVWACILAIAGRNAAEVLGVPRLFCLLAWWVLAGGVAAALTALMQFTGWWQFAHGMVFPPSRTPGDGVYGNLAQQNHFATHIALALGSAAHLRATARLNRWQFGALGLGLVCILLLSGSRSSFLYLACIGLAWMLCGRELSRRNWRRLAVIAAGFMAAGALLYLAATWSLLGPRSERLLAFSSGTGPRLYFWQHAWTMFTAHPIIGVGIDRFADALITQLSATEKVWGVDQYAHNLVLQLLAGTGLLGFAALALPLGLFVRRIVVGRRERAHLWGWVVLGILFIHSMLEQPLHYAYFLGIAAFVAGAMDVGGARLRPGVLVSVAMTICLAGSLVWLVKTARDYDALATQFYGEDSGDTTDARHLELIAALHANSMFAPMAELISPESFVAADAPAADKLAFNTRLLGFAPIAEVAFRQAALLAENGQIDAAKMQFQQAARAYPQDAGQYAQRLTALAASDSVRFAGLAAFAAEHNKLASVAK